MPAYLHLIGVVKFFLSCLVTVRVSSWIISAKGKFGGRPALDLGLESPLAPRFWFEEGWAIGVPEGLESPLG